MRWAALGALSAALAVAAGAFGAHALRGQLSPAALATFETGVRYQLVHALALVALGLAAPRLERGAVRAIGILFALGTVLFAGSLYALAVTGVRVLGAVTPFGGLCFIAGWLVFARALASKRAASVALVLLAFGVAGCRAQSGSDGTANAQGDGGDRFVAREGL